MDVQRQQERLSCSGERKGVAVLGCEWRVLRFNEVTRQSVAKILSIRKPHFDQVSVLQIPTCLAFEYLKSMLSAALGSISCALDLEPVARGEKKLRALCIGLGGGSLPLFLANKLLGCHVEVVEIDKTVISAATEFMGFPHMAFNRSVQSVGTSTFDSSGCSLWGGIDKRIAGYEADGVGYVCEVLGQLEETKVSAQYYDLVFIDAFDGKDQVPFCFWNKNGPFLPALGRLLHPVHGTVVVNLHTDMAPPSLLERITGEFGPGFDPTLPGGKQVLTISRAYRDKLLPSADVGRKAGVAFTVAVPRQQNICLVASRGVKGNNPSVLNDLKERADALEHMLKLPFNVSKRVSRGFSLVT